MKLLLHKYTILTFTNYRDTYIETVFALRGVSQGVLSSLKSTCCTHLLLAPGIKAVHFLPENVKTGTTFDQILARAAQDQCVGFNMGSTKSPCHIYIYTHMFIVIVIIITIIIYTYIVFFSGPLCFASGSGSPLYPQQLH